MDHISSTMIKILTILVLVLSAQGILFSEPKEVCYARIGCFSNAKPFDNTKGTLPDSPENIQPNFMLYTRANKTTAQILNPYDSATISKSNFAASRRTVFITHGFTDTANTGWSVTMKDAFLLKGDMNVILVDWSKGTKGVNYMKSAANTRVVGATIGNMVKALKDTANSQLNQIHLVGHSLGAQIMGYAGDWTSTNIRIGRVGRITGLDPAGLYFERFDNKVKLDPSDAMFVDVIHTNAASLLKMGFGIRTPNGHVDFYPNGGRSQPGCDVLQAGCSHMRAIPYFTESINSSCQFKAFKCTDYDAFLNGKCTSCSTGCNRMGYHASKNTQGKFYLQTNSKSPFCKNQ